MIGEKRMKINELVSEKWKTIIQKFLVEDENISELETNGTYSLFVRRKGIREEIQGIFSSHEEYLEETLKLAKDISRGQSIENAPMKYLAEGKLQLTATNTTRVHIVLPPACDYPLVTMARKSPSLTTLDSIFKNGSMSFKMFNFIKAAVDCKLTMVLSGSTGSGKTTFLEATTKLIDRDTRIGVLEDSPELTLIQPNTIYMHSMPWRPGMSPNDEVTLDWLMRQINRARTDLVIIGETRGSEFKQFITAANSGMEGSLTTLHANNPKMALQKMAQFVMEAQPQPIRTINKSIAGAIDIIIQLSKNLAGEYKTMELAEVSETLGRDENAEIATTSLAKYDENTKKWEESFLMSDKLIAKFEAKGYDRFTFIKKGAENGQLSYNQNRGIPGRIPSSIFSR